MFLSLNDLEYDVSVDDLDVDYVDASSFARSENLTLDGVTYREVREWSFEVPVWDSGRVAEAYRGWLKGRGHYWTFQRVDGSTTRFNKYSADGGPGFDFNLTGATASLAKFGSWAMMVHSGDTSSVTVGFGSEGRYSISLWKRDSGGTHVLCSAVYDGATTIYKAGADGNGVTTAFAWCTLSAASGSLGIGLQGENQSGTSATAVYSGLMVVPYALTTAQLTARNGRTTAEPAFPYLELDGDFNEDLSPILVKGFVESETFNPTSTLTRTPRIRLVQR